MTTLVALPGPPIVWIAIAVAILVAVHHHGRGHAVRQAKRTRKAKR